MKGKIVRGFIWIWHLEDMGEWRFSSTHS